MSVEPREHQADADFGTTYRRYVLTLLALAFGLSYLDRFLITLLLQPIQQDLQLSDSQLGFLGGIAFGLFYATLGLPIARWADRGNRVTIASLAIGLWGITVMFCLAVTNFVQLVFARVAASVGEAGCMPPTSSLIGDYFPRSAERTRAMAAYWLAAPIASLVGFVLGGWLNEHYGWRVTLFLAGIPGLLAAGVIKLTVKEPRVHLARTRVEAPMAPSLRDTLLLIWQKRALRHLSLGIIVLFSMGQGLTPWYAAFMIRSHHMGTAELGVWLGLIFGFSGSAGILLGSYISNRFLAHSERGQMRLSGALIAAVMPCLLMFLLLRDMHLALLSLVPLAVLFNFILGPAFALLQRLVPDTMRATTLAAVMLFANLIGMGLAPQIVGILSDLLKASLGMDSLRFAMVIASSLAFWAAWHFWRAGRTVGRDLMAGDPLRAHPSRAIP